MFAKHYAKNDLEPTRAAHVILAQVLLAYFMMHAEGGVTVGCCCVCMYIIIIAYRIHLSCSSSVCRLVGCWFFVACAERRTVLSSIQILRTHELLRTPFFLPTPTHLLTHCSFLRTISLVEHSPNSQRLERSWLLRQTPWRRSHHKYRHHHHFQTTWDLDNGATVPTTAQTREHALILAPHVRSFTPLLRSWRHLGCCLKL